MRVAIYARVSTDTQELSQQIVLPSTEWLRAWMSARMAELSPLDGFASLSSREREQLWLTACSNMFRLLTEYCKPNPELRKQAADIRQWFDEMFLQSKARPIHSHSMHRAAWLKASPGHITVEQWLTMKKAYRQRCAYCGKKTKKLTKDHVIPLSAGGSDGVGNILPACWPCNREKNAFTDRMWSESQLFLV